MKITNASELLDLVIQYRDDLRRPVTDSGSIERRLEAIDEAIAGARHVGGWTDAEIRNMVEMWGLQIEGLTPERCERMADTIICIRDGIVNTSPSPIEHTGEKE